LLIAIPSAVKALIISLHCGKGTSIESCDVVFYWFGFYFITGGLTDYSW
jgi:hypothetical protein